MLRLIIKLTLSYIPFFLTGTGLIATGFLVDSASLTGDGFNLRITLIAAGGFFILLTGVIFGVIFLFAVVKQRRAQDLLETGKQGTARVLRLEDTGMRINDNPRVKLLLEMNFEGYQPYQVWKKVTVPMIYISQIQTGNTVRVLADPNDPQNQKRIGLMLG